MTRRQGRRSSRNDDLAISNLVADIVVLGVSDKEQDPDERINAAIRRVAEAAGSSPTVSFGALLSDKDPEGVEELKSTLREADEAVSYGMALPAFISLMTDPPRFVELQNGDYVLIGAFAPGISTESVICLLLTWRISNAGDVATARLIDLDEYRFPQDWLGLERKLMEIAQTRGPVRTRPKRRCLFVTNNPDIDSGALEATAVVAGFSLDVKVITNPQDTASMQRLDELLRGGGYELLVTFTDPTQTWVWRRVQAFKERGGHHRVLHATTVAMLQEELSQELRRHVSPSAPPGVSSWGDVAAAIPDLEHSAFAFSSEARAMCSGDNAYLHPARMLEHLQALSSAARAWAKQGGSIGVRLDEWAIGKYGLEIALHDANGGAGMFVHDGVRLSAEPHVKVDDAKAPNECGRIYFGIDKDGLRFVVHHVGVHI